ncbi:MAG: DNA primase [Candidatus Bipolaricaulia bacterium]
MPTRDEIETIRSRINIVDVVARYVAVRASGNNYLALCPFHPDESPSMTVSADKGLFHCFGCGAGGDVYTFLSKIENVEFPDAVRRLADEAGIRLTESREQSQETGGLRQLAERVCQFYERQLRSDGGAQARAYLAERGITDETMSRFRLGYAPAASGALLNAFRNETEDLAQLSLVRRGQGGRWSFFRDRVIFPLMSTQGEVLSFAGRALEPDDDPKYLNTANTPIFTKSKLLYGLPQARDALRQGEQALLVEGYTDVIMAHQHGFRNAVASMGTSLTKDHAHLLKRYVTSALLAYDRDTAGQTATLRGVKQLLSAGLDVRVVLLPPDGDPDDLLRESGTEAFQEALSQSVPFSEFFVKSLLETHDPRALPGQEAMIAAARDFLSGLDGPALRTQILKELGSALDIPVEDLRGAMERMKGRGATVTMEPQSSEHWGVEEHLMHLLLHGEYSVDRAIHELEPDDFSHYAEAIDVLFKLYREEEVPQRFDDAEGQRALTAWLDRLDPQQAERLRALAVSERRDDDSERALTQLLEGQLRLKGIDRRLRTLNARIREAEAQGDREGVDRLQREQQELSIDRQKLLRQLGWGAIASQGGGGYHG